MAIQMDMKKNLGPSEVKRNLIVSIALVLSLYIIGSLVYNLVEGWGLVDSVYFVTATITTIGYGDVVPETDLGKLFTILLIWSGISIGLFLVYRISAYRETTFDHHVMDRLNIIRNVAFMKSVDTRPERAAVNERLRRLIRGGK